MADCVGTWPTGDYVYSLALSSDGTCVATSVYDKVILWDVDSGRMILGPLRGHCGLVLSVAFGPNGSILASGSTDCTIRVWDIASGGRAASLLIGHTYHVTSVMFSYDGRHLVSGSFDDTIRVWDVRTGQAVGSLIRTGTSVFSVAISADSRIVIGGLSNGTIKAFNSLTSALLFQCTGHMSKVYSLSLSPDGRFLASGADDGTVRIWDTTTGVAAGDILQGHADQIRSVVFSCDGKYLASGSNDKTIRIWDVENRTLHTGPLRGHTGSIYGLAFVPANRLISGSHDKTIKLWDIHGLDIEKPTRSENCLELEARDIDTAITHATTHEDILLLLGAHGCLDMTAQLDLTACGNYPILSGGFGDIFRGKLINGVDVAIKTMRLYTGSDGQNSKYLKHAARELYTWSKCQHVHVQPLLGLVTFRGQIGMLANWEHNGNLHQYLERCKDADRCLISVQISEGLAYLHESGVIHGDLKGANVLVSKDGLAQLADFGSAVLHEYSLKFTKTSTKECISPRWAAPELFQGVACNKSTDIYALGMTILEAITGDIPWSGRPDLTVMFAVMNKANPERPLHHIPTQSKQGNTLWSLLVSCWEFEPRKRPTAMEVHTMMKSITVDGLRYNPDSEIFPLDEEVQDMYIKFIREHL